MKKERLGTKKVRRTDSHTVEAKMNVELED